MATLNLTSIGAPTIALKVCKKCEVARPTTEFSKRSRSADGLGYTCKVCARARSKDYYRERLKDLRTQARESDPVAFDQRRRESQSRGKAKHQKWVEENAARALELKKARILAMSDSEKVAYNQKAAQQMRSWRARNEGRFREWRKAWDEAHRDRVCHYASKRNLRKKTPTWANLDAIADVYARAKELEEFTGEAYDVDHIYPLNSKWVCGLHCEANLRAIPSKLNGSKLNKLPGYLSHELWNPNAPWVFHEGGQT